jgi:hypothetical protein
MTTILKSYISLTPFVSAFRTVSLIRIKTDFKNVHQIMVLLQKLILIKTARQPISLFEVTQSQNRNRFEKYPTSAYHNHEPRGYAIL